MKHARSVARSIARSVSPEQYIPLRELSRNSILRGEAFKLDQRTLVSLWKRGLIYADSRFRFTITRDGLDLFGRYHSRLHHIQRKKSGPISAQIKPQNQNRQAA